MYTSAAKLRSAYARKLAVLERVGRPAAPGATVLDFGCGAGLAIRELRRRGFDAYGFDVQEKQEPITDVADLVEAGIVRVNADETAPLPFPDGMFDVVFSYQVFEHVHDYDHSLAELARVMKPDGVSLHVFPSRWRPFEAHVGVPFSSVIRSPWWLGVWARLGWRKSYQKKYARAEIARRNRRFLIEKTHYLSGREIRRHFEARFGRVAFVERAFLACHGRAAAAAGRVPGLPALFSTFWTRAVLAADPAGAPRDA